MRKRSDLILQAVIVSRRNTLDLFEAESIGLLDAIAHAAAKQTKQAITESSAVEKSRSIFRRVGLGPGWMENYFKNGNDFDNVEI
jgi:hypothetical protein